MCAPNEFADPRNDATSLCILVRGTQRLLSQPAVSWLISDILPHRTSGLTMPPLLAGGPDAPPMAPPRTPAPSVDGGDRAQAAAVSGVRSPGTPGYGSSRGAHQPPPPALVLYRVSHTDLAAAADVLHSAGMAELCLRPPESGTVAFESNGLLLPRGPGVERGGLQALLVARLGFRFENRGPRIKRLEANATPARLRALVALGCALGTSFNGLAAYLAATDAACASAAAEVFSQRSHARWSACSAPAHAHG